MWPTLWARLSQAPILGQVRFELPAGRGRKARTVVQRIRAERIELNDGARGRLAVTCALAFEITAPAGSKPVVWRLLSNRKVETLELVDGYRARWEIEPLFLLLKEGSRIEALQLEDVERIETAPALYLVVPVRLNGQYAIMHNKFIVADGQSVETGSFNYTASAEKHNAENAPLIRNAPELAAKYQQEFNRLWSESSPLKSHY